MSASGLCEICQQRDVDETCDRCGKLVCDRHFESELGFCVECSADVGPADPARNPDTDDAPDGVDTYRF